LIYLFCFFFCIKISLFLYLYHYFLCCCTIIIFKPMTDDVMFHAIQIKQDTLFYTQEDNFLSSFFFLITVCIWVSLRASRLILWDPKVNDQVSFQWSWDLWHSNWWLLKSKLKTWPIKLHLSGLSSLQTSYVIN
jgi:hypothetical protein